MKKNANISPFVTVGNRLFLLWAFNFLFLVNMFGQQEEATLTEINAERIQLTRNAMWVLGGWAAGNILSGSILRSTTEGKRSYFHEMNLFWGVVNLGIAGVGIYQSYHTDPSALDVWGSIKAQHNLEKILLINDGLNVAYIMTGLYLRERGLRQNKPSVRLEGYGNSLILQGSFLLLFDTIQYLVYHQKITPQLREWISHITISPQSIGLTFAF